MAAYYNEIDRFAAEWLRQLIKRNLIAPGDVDERSIEDVRPDDLKPYTQCHFFAGIGIWSYALRLAGWPDDRPVWTGSCPCQPFSAAGKGNGFTDERHLWPAFHFLIEQCRPGTVFGEQVASRDGLAWLDLVHSDMEATGYSFGAFDMCAAGFGAPHIRQRLYFVADTESQRREPQQNLHASGIQRTAVQSSRTQHRPSDICPTLGIMADTSSQQTDTADAGRLYAESSCGSIESRMGNPKNKRASGHSESGEPDRKPPCRGRSGNASDDGASRLTNGHWRDADWLFCRDGKWRPVEPGTFPLAHGASARVGRLRGYGNGIVATQAAEFIKAYRYGRGLDLV